MPLADRGGCLVYFVGRMFGAEGDSCQVRTVTGEHELTHLLTWDRLSKSFLAGLLLTPTSSDGVRAVAIF